MKKTILGEMRRTRVVLLRPTIGEAIFRATADLIG